MTKTTDKTELQAANHKEVPTVHDKAVPQQAGHSSSFTTKGSCACKGRQASSLPCDASTPGSCGQPLQSTKMFCQSTLDYQLTTDWLASTNLWLIWQNLFYLDTALYSPSLHRQCLLTDRKDTWPVKYLASFISNSTLFGDLWGTGLTWSNLQKTG